MYWNEVPILTVGVVGFIGFSLMAAAFLMVARQGGWAQAMKSKPDGRWSLPRRLMFVGALLGAVFGVAVPVLFAIPGGIPWSDGPDWTGIAVMLPTLAAVWYLIIRPNIASRRRQHEAAHHSG
jgi:hypothetical protein